MIPKIDLYSGIGYSFLRSLFRPTPLIAQLYITRRCNFHCRYCGAVDNSRPDPTLEQLKERILKLKSLGCRIIGLMGGEPTLRSDVVALVKFCRQEGIFTQLPTNGTFLMTKPRGGNGRTLLRNLIEAGVGMISLSVDSVASGFFTSQKELPKTKAVFWTLMKERDHRRLAITLNCVVTRENIAQVPSMLEFCHSHKIMMMTIFAQNPHPISQNKSQKGIEKILLSAKDKKILLKLLNYLREKKKHGYRLVEPFAYYEQIERQIEGKAEWECGAGKEVLIVDIDGRVGICGYLPFSGINIMDLNGDYSQRLSKIRKKYLPECSRRCLPLCMFGESYYRRHPLEFIINQISYFSRS